MKIILPFNNNEFIDKRYTFDGDNINPEIKIIDAPVGTEFFALIVDDPDAPRGDFVHWVMYNIPKDVNIIKENSVPIGAILGKNDFGKLSYLGPSPPSGTHRYFFKLYALDKKLSDKEGLTKKELVKEMNNHIIESAEIVGLYKRD